MSTKPTTAHDAYIALGSNLGDREKNLRRALDLIDAQPQIRLITTSAFYETAPRFVEDQPHFINACAHLQTSLSPAQILHILLNIEREMGRIRTIDKGPRTIDLDILFYADLIIKAPNLIIPHPDLHNRDFVLIPLVEIAPHLIHPVLNRRADALLADLNG